MHAYRVGSLGCLCTRELFGDEDGEVFKRSATSSHARSKPDLIHLVAARVSQPTLTLDHGVLSGIDGVEGDDTTDDERKHWPQHWGWVGSESEERHLEGGGRGCERSVRAGG